jgi:hypothetical protein
MPLYLSMQLVIVMDSFPLEWTKLAHNSVWPDWAKLGLIM